MMKKIILLSLAAISIIAALVVQAQNAEASKQITVLGKTYSCTADPERPTNTLKCINGKDSITIHTNAIPVQDTQGFLADVLNDNLPKEVGDPDAQLFKFSCPRGSHNAVGGLLSTVGEQVFIVVTPTHTVMMFLRKNGPINRGSMNELCWLNPSF